MEISGKKCLPLSLSKRLALKSVKELRASRRMDYRLPSLLRALTVTGGVNVALIRLINTLIAMNTEKRKLKFDRRPQGE